MEKIFFNSLEEILIFFFKKIFEFQTKKKKMKIPFFLQKNRPPPSTKYIHRRHLSIHKYTHVTMRQERFDSWHKQRNKRSRQRRTKERTKERKKKITKQQQQGTKKKNSGKKSGHCV